MRECVDSRHGIAQRISPGQVQSGSSRCGDSHVADNDDLVVIDALFPNLHSVSRSAIGVDDRGWQGRIDPLGAVQSRGGEAGQYTTAA